MGFSDESFPSKEEQPTNKKENTNIFESSEEDSAFFESSEEDSAFFESSEEDSALLSVLDEKSALFDMLRENSFVSSKTDEFSQVPVYFGRYKLCEEIGRGGMGKVYRAIDPSLDREIALKVISGEDDRSLTLFLQEARATARLNHPNIVKIYDIGKAEDKNFFTMDYIRGKTLSQIIKEHPLSPDLCIEIIEKIALAMYEAHKNGIIHRDIKPSNIMLDQDGEPKIMDFGLAKVIEARTKYSQTGVVLGTPAYMSPEQALGKNSLVDEKSDIYSLGICLYEMITGRTPYHGSNFNVIMQILEHDPIAPRFFNPEISKDIETICLKCIDKKPIRRYQNCQLLADDIKRYLDNKPILARPTSVGYKVMKWLVRNRGIVTVAAIAFIVLITVVVSLQWKFIHQQQQELEMRNKDFIAVAKEHIEKGNLRDSILELKRVSSNSPLYLDAQEYLKQIEDQLKEAFDEGQKWKEQGEGFFKQEKYSQATKMFENAKSQFRQVLSWDPRHLQALPQLPNMEKKILEIKNMRREKARVPFDKAMLIAYSRHLQERDLKQCEEFFNKAIVYDDKFAEAYYQRGRILQRQLQISRTIKDYETCIALDPAHTAARYYQAIILISQNNTNTQFDDKKLKEIFQFTLATNLSTDQDPYILLASAYACAFGVQPGGYKKAIALCDQAQQVAPYFPDIYGLRAMLRSYFISEYRAHGIKSMKEEASRQTLHFGKALKDIEQYLRLSGQSPFIIFLRGIILTQLGDFAIAERDLATSIEIIGYHNLSTFYRSIYCFCLLAQKKFSQTIPVITKEIELLKKDIGRFSYQNLIYAYMVRSECHLFLKDYQSAAVDIDAAWQLEKKHGDFPIALVQKVLLSLFLGKKQQAITEVKQFSTIFKRFQGGMLMTSAMFLRNQKNVRQMLLAYPYVFAIPPDAKQAVWLLHKIAEMPGIKRFRPRSLGHEVVVPAHLFIEWINQSPHLRKEFNQIFNRELMSITQKISPLLIMEIFPAAIEVDTLPWLSQVEKLASAKLYYRRATYYYLTKNFQNAQKDLQQVITLEPGNLKAHYALATVMAIRSQTDSQWQQQALFHLWVAIELGWKHVSYTMHDPDFQSLAKLPQFHLILQKQPTPLQDFANMKKEIKKLKLRLLEKDHQLLYQALESKLKKAISVIVEDR